MADIFLSYARADLAKAELFVAALERQGWSVFWDTTSILGGEDFDAVIEAAIESAACMVVLWSEAAKKSHYVRGEARFGRDLGILVPLLIEPTRVPLDFGAIHTENFSTWQGDINASEFIRLKRAITHKLASNLPPPATTPAPTTPLVVTQPPPPKPPTLAYIEPEMVLIPAGRFNMGSNDYKNEQPIHSVTLAQPFYLGKYPVTFAEYALYVQATQGQLPDDKGWGRGKRPVINVSWQEANDYAAWLSAQTGKAYRLPTEAEWEYACRAGTNSRFYWGGKEKDAGNYAWFSSNSDDKTHAVGEKQPNAWVLYDMAGNVWEWLQDCYVDNYHQAPSSSKAYQTFDSSTRVVRGGSWTLGLNYLSSTQRLRFTQDQRLSFLGFRLAQD